MSRPGASASRATHVWRAVALVLLTLLLSVAVHAQCPRYEDDPTFIPKIASAKRPLQEEPLLPEAAFLSDTHYTNQFFGFGFDLPLSVHGHEIMLPVMPARHHALLALQYEKDQHHGSITVTAVDPRPGSEVNTPDQQEAELRSWAQSGTEFGAPSAFPVPDFMLRSGRFYYSVRRHAGNFTAQYWTRINNYGIKVVINTNDAVFLHQAKNAMANARFYCPQDDGTLVARNGQPLAVEGAPYQGPTVPTYKVNAAIRDEPGKSIPLGAMKDGVYRNPEAGMQFDIPAGWDSLPAAADDPPPDAAALREYQFLHACSQTLLRIAPYEPNPSRISPPASRILLRAMDPNCLSMHTATTLRDKRELDEVAASMEEMAEFGKINSDELVSTSGHLFMVFHGTIATTTRGAQLSQRMSQTIFATRYNKLLWVWSLMAPTSTALGQIPTSRILLDGSSPIEIRSAVQPKK